MKTISADFRTMLRSSQALMTADLYTITLLSGTVLYYTDAPQNITYGGHTYVAAGASYLASATAAVFGTGDGSTTAFQLRDGQGNSIVSGATVTGMHRTDWRGRVALSASARTNLLPYSTDLTHWAPVNGTVGAGVGSPSGFGTMTRLTCTTANANVQVAETATATIGATYTLSAYVRRDQNRYVKLFGFGNGSGGVVIDLQTGATQVNSTWVSVGVQLIDANTARIYGVVQPLSSGQALIGMAANMAGTGTVTVGSYLDVWGAQLEAGSSATALIATASTALTVVDYSVSSSGLVTLGEAPAAAATLDWDGSGMVGNTAPGFGRGPIRLAIGLQVESLEVDVLYDADTRIQSLTPGAFANAGGFDGARIKVDKFLTPNLNDTSRGVVNLFTGVVSDVSAGSGKVSLNVSSDLVYLNAAFPRNYFLPQCNNALFDAGCGLLKSAFAVTGSVDSGTVTTITDAGLTQASGWFALGYVVITSGVNAGLTRSVRDFGGGVLTLLYPLPAPCAAGDAFTVYPGCDKTQATCSGKFGNLARFRGFPYVPTPEQIEMGGSAPASGSGGGAGLGSGGIGRGPGGQNNRFDLQ